MRYWGRFSKTNDLVHSFETGHLLTKFFAKKLKANDFVTCRGLKVAGMDQEYRSMTIKIKLNETTRK